MVAHGVSGMLKHVLTTCLLCGCAASFDPMAGQTPESFCTFDAGYVIGANGSDYMDLCPDVLAPAFADGYQTGYAIHLAQLELEALEGAIRSVSDDLQRTWRGSADVAAKLNRTAETSARRTLQNDANALTTRQIALTRQLDELEADVASRKTQLLAQQHLLATNR